MKIPRIKLSKNSSWEEFIKDNPLEFWEMTVNAVNELIENPDIEDYTAFVLHGGKLDKEKQFIVERKDISETLDKALSTMESMEEYEMCSKIVEIKKNNK